MSDAAFVQSQLSFRVKDVKASAKFYEEVLGFITESYHETPWEYAVIRRENVIIHLTIIQLSENIIGKGCGIIVVKGIKEIWQKVKDSDWILTEPELKNYGNIEVKEFALRDIDGNVLRFQEEV